MPKLKKKLDAFDLGRFRKSKFVLTGCAGMFGMPPATLLAGAGALFEARAIRFLAILFAGRLIRFLVIAGAPTLFLSFFDVNPSEVLPDWVKVSSPHQLFHLIDRTLQWLTTDPADYVLCRNGAHC